LPITAAVDAASVVAPVEQRSIEQRSSIAAVY
jgi:hypothetical protein